jgi:hypothetical protein
MASCLQAHNVYLGCDPELFVVRNGKVIGGEKVISENGLPYMSRKDPTKPWGGTMDDTKCKFVLDGVQIEMTTSPFSCREVMGDTIACAFATLKEHLKKYDAKPCFDAVVEVDPEEMATLSEKARIFGCAPSENIYGPQPIEVDPTVYLKRAAGGHIHLGLFNPIFAGIDSKIDYRTRLVPILDILVGNTSVMVDRDPGAVERRKAYGRAGEFRLPKHGLEYRTLSNFWIKDYRLLSFVMGLSRLSVAVLGSTLQRTMFDNPKYRGIAEYAQYLDQPDYEAELLKKVDIEQIRAAINKNDLDLAQKNFEGVKAFLADHVRRHGFELGDCA